MPVIASPDLVIPVSASGADRRVHPRLKASELGGLVTVRVKYGSEVRLIDLSVGGALIETSDRLAADSSVVFEFAGPGSTLIVPSRVVRVHALSHLDDSGRHEGAFAFKRPLPLTDLLKEPADAWHKVVARYHDGRIVQGYTKDFQPARRGLHVHPTPFSDVAREVAISELETIFFLRDGATGTPEAGTAPGHGLGRRVSVTLPDGDTLIGTSLNYRRDGNGFFVHLTDHANTLKVFITPWAARNLRFF